MSFSDKIIWSEGMFLQPQHFQQNDRYLENLILKRPALLEPYHWGINELKIDEQLLTLGKFALKICRGILPDGTPFDIPARDKAPPQIDIPAGLTHSEIFLALPLQRAGNAEAGNLEPNQALPSWRYTLETIEVSDNNAFSDLTIPLQVGKLALRLMLETADRAGYSCLGIAKVLEVRADHKIILDEQYLAPCLNVHAVDNFASLLQEMQSLLHYRGDMLVQRLTDAGTGGIAEIADFMLLQLINRYEPLITHLNQLRHFHPEHLYRLLVQLLGELTTFTNRQRRPMSLPIYLHDNLQATYTPVINELRRALSIVLEENVVAFKIEQQVHGIWVAALHDKSLLIKAQFILAVHADLPPETIRNYFPAQIKIAPVEEIRNLVNRALPGIELRPLSVAPRSIPYHANFTYFTLNRDHQLWDQLEKSAAIAFHVGGDFPGLRLELWAIKDK